jgi:serine/threonine protein phosphatase PrpC
MTTLLLGSSKKGHYSLQNHDLTLVNQDWPDKVRYRIRFYGQDMLAIVDSCPGILGPDERLFGVFDGHGECGQRWAQVSGTLLLQHILISWWQLKRMLRREDGKSRVTNKLKSLFRFAETECLRPHHIGPDSPGGTTATVTLVMIVRRRRWVIQVAVGDSPGYLATVEDSETRVSETRVSETRVSETRVSETRVSETRVSETRVSETRVKEVLQGIAITLRR